MILLLPFFDTQALRFARVFIVMLLLPIVLFGKKTRIMMMLILASGSYFY